MILQIVEQATTSIVETGVIAIVLTAGLILMYRHFNRETKELKEVINEKDAQKDELNVQIKDIIKNNAELNARLLDTIVELKEHLKNVQ